MCLADCSSVYSAEVLSQSGRDPGIPGIDKKYLSFLWTLMSAHVIDLGNRLASLVIDLGLRCL